MARAHNQGKKSSLNLKVGEKGATFLRPIDLARAIGVSTQMVRKYEEWNFLPPVERGQNGYRRYRPLHLYALETARLLVIGYGWEPARHMMQRIHQGDTTEVLVAIDAYHANLHQRRQATQATLKALREVIEKKPQLAATKQRYQQPEKLHVSEAARQVGVRSSAVRFWEEQGLLHPQRDKRSKYRLYDEEQLIHLQVVALLRQVGYGFEAIRSVLAEVAVGRMEQAVRAAERRLLDLLSESELCSAATAAAWNYVQAVREAETKHL